MRQTIKSTFVFLAMYAKEQIKQMYGCKFIWVGK